MILQVELYFLLFCFNMALCEEQLEHNVKTISRRNTSSESKSRNNVTDYDGDWDSETKSLSTSINNNYETNFELENSIELDGIQPKSRHRSKTFKKEQYHLEINNLPGTTKQIGKQSSTDNMNTNIDVILQKTYNLGKENISYISLDDRNVMRKNNTLELLYNNESKEANVSLSEFRLNKKNEIKSSNATLSLKNHTNNVDNQLTIERSMGKNNLTGSNKTEIVRRSRFRPVVYQRTTHCQSKLFPFNQFYNPGSNLKCLTCASTCKTQCPVSCVRIPEEQNIYHTRKQQPYNMQLLPTQSVNEVLSLQSWCSLKCSQCSIFVCSRECLRRCSFRRPRKLQTQIPSPVYFPPLKWNQMFSSYPQPKRVQSISSYSKLQQSQTKYNSPNPNCTALHLILLLPPIMFNPKCPSCRQSSSSRKTDMEDDSKTLTTKLRSPISPLPNHSNCNLDCFICPRPPGIQCEEDCSYECGKDHPGPVEEDIQEVPIIPSTPPPPPPHPPTCDPMCTLCPRPSNVRCKEECSSIWVKNHTMPVEEDPQESTVVISPPPPFPDFPPTCDPFCSLCPRPFNVQCGKECPSTCTTDPSNNTEKEPEKTALVPPTTPFPTPPNCDLVCFVCPRPPGVMCVEECSPSCPI